MVVNIVSRSQPCSNNGYTIHQWSEFTLWFEFEFEFGFGFRFRFRSGVNGFETSDWYFSIHITMEIY